MSENGQLPHWDMSVIYPSLESDAFNNGFQSVMDNITELGALLEKHQINRVDELPINDGTVAIFETLIDKFNTTLEAFSTLRAYIYGFIATDSRHAKAQAKNSEMQPYMAKLSLYSTQFTAWLGSMDVDAMIEKSEVAKEHAYVLRKAQKQSLHLMSPIEESLASELKLTGGSSWTRLFSTFSSQLTVDLELDGEQKTMPLTAVQNLAYNPDRDVRRRAHEKSLETLEKAAVPMAAALNAIKGETLTLAKRRGWDSPLDMVLFDNAIDRPTLDAMMSATRKAFPDFRRYLHARALALGLPVLHWYDRIVPLDKGTQSWAYKDATQFVIDQFGTYSEKLKNMAETAFAEGWIDAEPRDGKQGGAFCMSLRPGESRILSNFEPGFTSVGTLAHELGHAYHNLNLADRKPLQRSTPMTLAETASTFCQKIVENAALAKAGTQDQIIILDGLLEYAARVVLGATSNFMFEEQLFEKRKQRDLSVEELCALDVEMQQAASGDAVDPEHLHPYRWTYVPHYYVTTFYNFPYTFGLLFGLGLYAQYRQSPDTFKAGYETLLSSTGMGDAAELAAQFGIDLHSEAFWTASLDVLRNDIDRFVTLVDSEMVPA
ncbi:MAG: M3 family oligoendopeptidase [Chloroflexi bacterium]|nr:M3 family oligoendopeptidase [Chloroflexota bacterium]